MKKYILNKEDRNVQQCMCATKLCETHNFNTDYCTVISCRFLEDFLLPTISNNNT